MNANIDLYRWKNFLNADCKPAIDPKTFLMPFAGFAASEKNFLKRAGGCCYEKQSLYDW